MLQQQICRKTVKMLLSSYRWSFQQHLRTGIFYQSSTSSQGISENANFFKAFVNHHEFSCSELNSNCQRRDWLDTGEEWERNCERQKERLGGPMASTHPSFMQNIFYGSLQYGSKQNITLLAVSQNKIRYTSSIINVNLFLIETFLMRK